MKKGRIESVEDALAYITDCNLATVSHMAHSKSQRSRGEFKRQIAIAQKAVNLMQDFGVDYSGTRATEVAAKGSVEEWVKEFIV